MVHCASFNHCRPLKVQVAARSFLMNSKYVAAWAFPVLLLGCALANAQAAPRAAEAPTAPGVTSHLVTPTDADQPAANVADPDAPTAGHDDATGKDQPSPDLASPDSTQVEKATTRHPDFMTLDSNNHGYLTLDDVKHNKWLSSNFARCDADHDGHLSQQEYANCK
jgi:hypothetical protein